MTKSCAAQKSDPFCPACGRPLVPVKQLVFEALLAGESVRGAARRAKCSRQYVQQLRAAQLSLPLVPSVGPGPCLRRRG